MSNAFRKMMTAGRVWTCTIIWNNQTLFSHNSLMQNIQAAYKSVIKSLPSWGQKHASYPRKRFSSKLRNEKSLSSRIYCNFSDCKFQQHYRQPYKSCSWKNTHTHWEPLASEITLGGVKYFWGTKWVINLRLIVCFISLWNAQQCVVQSSLPICLCIHMHTNVFGCCNLTGFH